MAELAARAVAGGSQVILETERRMDSMLGAIAGVMRGDRAELVSIRRWVLGL